MIYLDNSATSFFKPKGVAEALSYDLLHQSNGKRSTSKDAMRAEMDIEMCRNYLKTMLGADESFELIFTKNCSEALNLAIFGIINDNDTVVTSANEHNSVLRPLFELKRQGKITMRIAKQAQNGAIDIQNLEDLAKGCSAIVVGGACNVTGAILDIAKVGEIARRNSALLIVDGAQSVPVCKMDMKNMGVHALCCPAHKGLHGLQGCGFLICKKDIPLRPMMYGGNGVDSQNLYPPITFPESYEIGTLFTGGIRALYQGAKWSFENAERTRLHLFRCSKILCDGLMELDLCVLSQPNECGIVCFNLKDVDSTLVASALSEHDVAVRAGFHCAPLVHEFLNTTSQGAVRLSVGCDTTKDDIRKFFAILKKVIASIAT